MTVFIGDVHGKCDRYHQIIREHSDTIQVGDMGIGFVDCFPLKEMINGNHRFIRGNHDNPFECINNSQWIKDGCVENDMMFMGGAYSIDKAYRTPGRDWWPEEELSYPELTQMIDIYIVTKPRIMVTHDAPLFLTAELYPTSNILTRTGQALQYMFEIHRPESWVFGHHHISLDVTILGTRFVCLAELETKQID